MLPKDEGIDKTRLVRVTEGMREGNLWFPGDEELVAQATTDWKVDSSHSENALGKQAEEKAVHPDLHIRDTDVSDAVRNLAESGKSFALAGTPSTDDIETKSEYVCRITGFCERKKDILSITVLSQKNIALVFCYLHRH